MSLSPRLSSLSPRCLLLSGSLLLLTLLGCDLTGEYYSRQKTSVGEISTRFEVMKHLGSTVVVPDPADQANKNGANVSLSLPKVLGNLPVGPDALGVAISGIVRYEAMSSKGEGPLMYLCVLPLDVGPLDQVLQKLEDAVKKLNPKVTVSVRDENLVSPANVPVDPMKHITISGEQGFFMQPNPTVQAVIQEQPGLMEIYVVTAPKHYVAFAFRATEAASKANDFAAAINSSMRTVSVTRGADAPAPPAAPVDPAAAPAAK